MDKFRFCRSFNIFMEIFNSFITQPAYPKCWFDILNTFYSSINNVRKWWQHFRLINNYAFYITYRSNVHLDYQRTDEKGGEHLFSLMILKTQYFWNVFRYVPLLALHGNLLQLLWRYVFAIFVAPRVLVQSYRLWWFVLAVSLQTECLLKIAPYIY